MLSGGNSDHAPDAAGVFVQSRLEAFHDEIQFSIVGGIDGVIT
ncbi:MAG: hypothetical protein WAK56_03555 [Candidatus Sulfotelmatobacter sp.]